MKSVKRTVWSAAMAVGLIAGGMGGATAQQAPAAAPAAASPAKVKELIGLLLSRKLEIFAAPENGPKFVAVLHVPGVQLLLASASYGRPLDFDYYLFHKKYQDMYQELKSSPLSVEKFFVEDTLADGLVVAPGKSGAIDVVTVGGERRTFDGDFADPRKRNQKKITQDDYFKAFSTADARYAALLDVLIAAAKKDAGLAASAGVR
jgi:hypothetical protein